MNVTDQRKATGGRIEGKYDACDDFAGWNLLPERMDDTLSRYVFVIRQLLQHHIFPFLAVAHSDTLTLDAFLNMLPE